MPRQARREGGRLRDFVGTMDVLWRDEMADREIYEYAYGKGADLRCRASETARRHANAIKARRKLDEPDQ